MQTQQACTINSTERKASEMFKVEVQILPFLEDEQSCESRK